ncbi:Putative ribonuclease H protein At1g65750, partial [Linum perenne]
WVFPLTQNLGRYLGVPILHERTTVQTYQGIVDRIDQKLTGWKANSLSLAGRVTLAQSVLAAIPAYAMQTAVIPVMTCEVIDRKIRNFVWGSTNEARKTHLVAWENVCKPKEEGGLGLKMARLLNRAYMMKLAFIFFQDPEKLWVRVLQGKYFKETIGGYELRSLRSQSPLWKGLSKEWETMQIGARSAIRDGRGTAFWTGRWLDSGARVIDLCEEERGIPDASETVADFVNAEGQWDVEKLLSLLSSTAVDSVVGMPPPKAGSGDDIWVWGGEDSGRFSIKSAYRILHSQPNVLSYDSWMSVWRWRGPNRIRHFLWLAIQSKLLTNLERTRRHMSTSASCSHCQHPEESVSHVLRDCPFAADVWTQIGGFDARDRGWTAIEEHWIQQNLKSKQGTLFGIVCWLVWKARNKRIFSGNSASAQQVAYQADSWVRMVAEAATRSKSISVNHNTRLQVEIAWRPGLGGAVTLNSDGSVDRARGKATAGGLIRNAEGRCVLAYTMNLGTCSITRAEMRGAIEGMHRAWEAGFRNVVLQLDSRSVISLFMNGDEERHQHGLEVARFRELRDRNWNLEIQHTYREGIRAADYLASIGYGYPVGSHTVLSADCNLGHFLRYDILGITESRSIAIND